LIHDLFINDFDLDVDDVMDIVNNGGDIMDFFF